MAELTKVRSRLKNRAWLTAFLSVLEGAAVYAIAARVKQGDFAPEADTPGTYMAPIAAAIGIVKSLLAISTRAKFKGALTHGVEEGKAINNEKARSHELKAARRRVRSRKAAAAA
jgi:hypothetical protein